MCYNCGCAIPDYDMGNPDNITNTKFRDLATKWSMDQNEVKKKLLKELQANTVETPEFITLFVHAAKAWGQTEEDARNKTQKLLERQSLT